MPLAVCARMKAILGAGAIAAVLSHIAACSQSQSDATSIENGGSDESADDVPAKKKKPSKDAGNNSCTPASLHVSASPIKLVPSRDHHVTLIRETAGAAYLTVLGGEQNDFSTIYDDVQRAKINEDGTIQPFTSAGKLDTPLAGAALAVHGDYVVLIGGVIKTTRAQIVAKTYVGHFAEDGTIDTWFPGPDLPTAVMHSAAVVVGDTIYAFGGTTGSAATKLAVRATISSDGKMTEWANVTSLNPGRSHQAAFLENGYIYVAGGLEGNPQQNPASVDSVVRAKVADDGSLGAWENAGALAEGISVSSIEKKGCAFYTFGGQVNGSSVPFSAAIFRGYVDSTGSFQPLANDEASLSIERGHVHQTPTYKDHMYSVGGRTNDTSSGTWGTTGQVDIGTFQ